MKINFYKIIIPVILLCLCFTSLYARDVSCGRGRLKEDINNYLENLTNKNLFNGSVLIAKKGKILFIGGFGMASFEKEISASPKTVYMIASLTKTFTAYSILLLEEQGLLQTMDTVDMYIPELLVGEQVSIHQLLNHSSGVFEFLNNPDIWMAMDMFHYPSELLTYFSDQPLDFPPGSDFSYSNSNYILLGIIIERITGMTFGEFIRKNIIVPFRLQNTGFTPYGDFPSLLATGYDDITVDPPVVSMYLSPSISYSAGGMYSDVFDIFKWSEGLFTLSRQGKKNKFSYLSPEGVEKLFTPGLGDYGYGWYIKDLTINNKLYKTISNPGDYLGYQGLVTRFVNEELTIIIEENHITPPVEGNTLTEITMALGEIILYE